MASLRFQPREAGCDFLLIARPDRLDESIQNTVPAITYAGPELGAATASYFADSNGPKSIQAYRGL